MENMDAYIENDSEFMASYLEGTMDDLPDFTKSNDSHKVPKKTYRAKVTNITSGITDIFIKYYLRQFIPVIEVELHNPKINEGYIEFECDADRSMGCDILNGMYLGGRFMKVEPEFTVRKVYEESLRLATVMRGLQYKG